jgi:uncharacterized protein with HEPN domain
MQIIGEAAGRLSDGLRASHSDVPWTEIIGMRNVLVHEYFGVDGEEIWATIHHDLPALKQRLAAILAALPPAT